MNTAYTVPLRSEQNMAWPLSNAGFIQFNMPLLIENEFWMVPGIVLGVKGSYSTPSLVEYVYTMPFVVAVSTPEFDMVYIGAWAQSFETVPSLVR